MNVNCMNVSIQMNLLRNLEWPEVSLNNKQGGSGGEKNAKMFIVIEAISFRGFCTGRKLDNIKTKLYF